MVNTDIAVILSDSSSYTQRYNLFAFTEGTDATLPETGDYYLEVYEQISLSNLDPDRASKKIHEEEVLVLKEPFVNKEHNPTITGYLYEFS